MQDPRLSPGFRERGDTERSYELKFRVDPARAAAVLEWARHRLDPDPFGDPALEGAYLVHTLYLDTAAFDVFHRSESFRRRKFRARRYGAGTTVQLEQKTRTGDRVAKRRTAVEPSAFEALGDPASLLDPGWGWFQHRIRIRRLLPSVRVTYLRSAFVGGGADGSLRLTVDGGIVAAPESSWSVDAVTDGTPVFPDAQVLELKYRRVLPGPFKELVTRFGLTPGSLSKYRSAVAALGLAGGGARGPGEDRCPTG